MRFVIYPIIIEHLGDRLWLGHGFGAFHDTFRPLVPLEAASAEWDFAHSTYLENLWEMGLPAALAFYGALTWVSVVIFRGAVKRRRNRLYPVRRLRLQSLPAPCIRWWISACRCLRQRPCSLSSSGSDGRMPGHARPRRRPRQASPRATAESATSS